MTDYEKFATNLLLAFSSIIIVGLMALHIKLGNKPGFIYALSASVLGWFSAFAIIFDKPKLYLLLVILAIVSVGCSITCYVK